MKRTNYHFIFTAILSLAALTGCNQSVPTGAVAESDEVQLIRAKLEGGGGGAEEVKLNWSPDGFATLRGRVVLEGTAPEDKPPLITSDKAVCGPAGQIKAGSIIMSADGGLANVLVYVEVKSKSMPIAPYAQKPRSEPLLLNQEKCIFMPHFVAIQEGETLRMKNSDSVQHDAAMKKLTQSVAYTIAPGGEKSHTFTKANKPVEITCNYHAWMRGYIFIHKNGYYQLTDKDGNFELKDVPCGADISIRVWHERVRGAGGFFKKPNITGSWAEKAKKTNTGFKIKLQPGEESKYEDLVLKVGSETIR